MIIWIRCHSGRRHHINECSVLHQQQPQEPTTWKCCDMIHVRGASLKTDPFASVHFFNSATNFHKGGMAEAVCGWIVFYLCHNFVRQCCASQPIPQPTLIERTVPHPTFPVSASPISSTALAAINHIATVSKPSTSLVSSHDQGELRGHLIVSIQTNLLSLTWFVYQSASGAALALVHSWRGHSKVVYLPVSSTVRLRNSEMPNEGISKNPAKPSRPDPQSAYGTILSR